jgi:hypothetical protein
VHPVLGGPRLHSNGTRRPRREFPSPVYWKPHPLWRSGRHVGVLSERRQIFTFKSHPIQLALRHAFSDVMRGHVRAQKGPMPSSFRSSTCVRNGPGKCMSALFMSAHDLVCARRASGDHPCRKQGPCARVQLLELWIAPSCGVPAMCIHRRCPRADRLRRPGSLC